MIMMGDKKKAITAILGPHSDNVGKRGEDGAIEEEGPDTLMVCMEELIDAIHAKDASAAVDAFRTAFEELEMTPHEEAPHEQYE
jgi:hypothetical protein